MIENTYLKGFYAKDYSEAAAISMILTITFVILSTISYNYRSVCTKKTTRIILVSKWDRILTFLYGLLMFVFEIVAIYGSAITNNDSAKARLMTISIDIALIWITMNLLSVIIISTSCFSKLKYRTLLYIPYVVQATGMIIILIQIASNLKPIFGVNISTSGTEVTDLILPLFMLFISMWITCSPPSMFSSDNRRVEYEERRKDKKDIYITLTDIEGLTVDEQKTLESETKTG